MKTSLLAWLILPLALMAQGRSFYAKVEPYETYEIKAATSGLVVSVQKSLEGKLVSQRETVIKLDDALEKSLLALDKKESSDDQREGGGASSGRQDQRREFQRYSIAQNQIKISERHRRGECHQRED